MGVSTGCRRGRRPGSGPRPAPPSTAAPPARRSVRPGMARAARREAAAALQRVWSPVVQPEGVDGVSDAAGAPDRAAGLACDAARRAGHGAAAAPALTALPAIPGPGVPDPPRPDDRSALG